MHILTHGRQNLAPRLAYHGVVVKHTEAASYPGLVEDLIPVRGKLRGFGTASTNHLLTPTLTSLNYPINLNYVVHQPDQPVTDTAVTTYQQNA